MARKLFFSFLATSALLVLSYSPASAKSGCCSSHGGVSCAAGPQTDGRVICNDGWTGSSCYYSEMVMCGGGYSTPVPTLTPTTPTPTVRPTTPVPTSMPTQTLRPTLTPTQTPRPTATPTPKPTGAPSPTTSVKPTVEGIETEAPSPTIQPTEVPTPTATPLVAGNSVSSLVLPIAYVGIPIFVIYKMMKKKEQTPPSV